MSAHQHMESAGAFHNMSAPPRSTLVLKPFPAVAASPAEAGESTNWGLSWVLRVDIDRIVLTTFPNWQPWNSLTEGFVPEPGLCGAVALAQTWQGIPTDPWDLCDWHVENLTDELMRLAPGRAEAPELPPLMMATRADEEKRALELDPVKALAVLTHLSGRVCDLTADPLVAHALLRGIPVDFWAPAGEAAHG